MSDSKERGRQVKFSIWITLPGRKPKRVFRLVIEHG